MLQALCAPWWLQGFPTKPDQGTLWMQAARALASFWPGWDGQGLTEQVEHRAALCGL